jgi:hypothetical protein
MQDEFRTLCMRVESPHPITLKSGELGWWHKFGEAPTNWKPPVKEVATPKIDVEAILDEWRQKTKPEWLYNLAGDLKVKPHSLLELNVAWAGAHKAWAFPMRDAWGGFCGIRLRAQDGKKWSVTGSRSGIFLPFSTPQKRLWICEGGTDCAALLSMNLFAIGRPSCSGGTDEINAAIRRLKIKEAVIISDNDEDKQIGGRTYNPGADGAKRLSERLIVPNCVITLPCKDAREFLALKGDSSMLESLTQNTLWKNH